VIEISHGRMECARKNDTPSLTVGLLPHRYAAWGDYFSASYCPDGLSVISVLRFFARLAIVVFGATGFDVPMPLAWMRVTSTPAAARRSDNTRARSWVSCCSAPSSPRLSVYDSITI